MVTLISYLNVVPTFTKNHLLFVPCMVLYKISPVFITFSTTIYVMFAMLCHCSVCVRLSHLIKDYLLTYLLTMVDDRPFMTNFLIIFNCIYCCVIGLSMCTYIDISTSNVFLSKLTNVFNFL